MMTGDIDVWVRPPDVPINQPSRTPRTGPEEETTMTDKKHVAEARARQEEGRACEEGRARQERARRAREETRARERTRASEKVRCHTLSTPLTGLRASCATRKHPSAFRAASLAGGNGRCRRARFARGRASSTISPLRGGLAPVFVVTVGLDVSWFCTNS